MPDRALTQLFDNLTGGTEQLQKDDLVTQTVQIGDVAIIYGITPLIPVQAVIGLQDVRNTAPIIW